MTDAAPQPGQPKQRKRKSGGKTAPVERGDVTFVRVPLPAASAFDKNRPAGCLLQAQLLHFRHAESARLPKEKRDGRRLEDIRTEAEAASYIAAVTRILHPQRRRKPKPPASS
jgi:hypothetical protein